jgi:8-oxo-dGTP diphosphatase
VKSMVVCLLFNKPRTEVLLIRKNRPAWQRGKFNGPGGVMEAGETPGVAAARELAEETGILTDPNDWRAVVLLEGTSKADGVPRCVWFLAAEYAGSLTAAAHLTDEEPCVFSLKEVYQNDDVLSNLNWIIPLAARADREGVQLPVTVEDYGL